MENEEIKDSHSESITKNDSDISTDAVSLTQSSVNHEYNNDANGENNIIIDAEGKETTTGNQEIENIINSTSANIDSVLDSNKSNSPIITEDDTTEGNRPTPQTEIISEVTERDLNAEDNNIATDDHSSEAMNVLPEDEKPSTANTTLSNIESSGNKTSICAEIPLVDSNSIAEDSKENICKGETGEKNLVLSNPDIKIIQGLDMNNLV